MIIESLDDVRIAR